MPRRINGINETYMRAEEALLLENSRPQVGRPVIFCKSHDSKGSFILKIWKKPQQYPTITRPRTVVPPTHSSNMLGFLIAAQIGLSA